MGGGGATQPDHGAAVGGLARRRDGRRQEAFAPRQRRLGKADGNLDRVDTGTAVRITDPHPAQKRADGVVQGLLLYAMEFHVLVVDLQMNALMGLAEGIVHVDDKVHRTKDLADAARRLAPAGRIGAVDLCHQGRQNGRPGRHLDDLDGASVGRRQGGESAARVERDSVALTVALVLGPQVDLELAVPGPVAQIGMAHQAVEVKGRRRARVGLNGGQFRELRQTPGGRHQHPLRSFQGRALGQVDDDLKLGLVVEG